MRFTTSTDVGKAQEALTRPKEQDPKLDRLRQLGDHRRQLKAALKEVNAEIAELVPECYEAGARKAKLERLSAFSRPWIDKLLDAAEGSARPVIK